MKFATTAALASLLFASSSALPADTGVTVAKVGDKPDVELFSRRSLEANLEKREALPNPKAQNARLNWKTMSASRAARVPFNQRTTTTAQSWVLAPQSSTLSLQAPTTTTTTTTITTSRPAATTSRAPASSSTSSRTSAPAVSATGNPQATVSRATTTSATTSAAAAGSTVGANIRDAALGEHNRFRALHGAKALVWDQTLADAAGRWASNCKFQHSQGAVGPYGENLAANAGTAPQGSQNGIVVGLIGLWEDEAPDYDPSNPNYSHFTQMVWKSTTNLGCVLQSCPGGTIFDAQYGNSNYLVCEYSPPGNVYPADNFRANVQP